MTAMRELDRAEMQCVEGGDFAFGPLLQIALIIFLLTGVNIFA